MRSIRIFCALVVVISCHADTLISTVGSWNGSNEADFFSNTNTTGSPVVGETITVPTNGDSVLSYFTLTLDDTHAAYSIPFLAVVQAWDAINGATGSPLFTSSSTTLLNGQFNGYTFYPNLSLTAGDSYVLLFESQSSPNPTYEPFADIASDVYPQGAYVYEDFGNTWYTSTNSDLVFSADFTSQLEVPEPSLPWLLLTGLAALIAVRADWRALTARVRP